MRVCRVRVRVCAMVGHVHARANACVCACVRANLVRNPGCLQLHGPYGGGSVWQHQCRRLAPGCASSRGCSQRRGVTPEQRRLVVARRLSVLSLGDARGMLTAAACCMVRATDGEGCAPLGFRGKSWALCRGDGSALQRKCTHARRAARAQGDRGPPCKGYRRQRDRPPRVGTEPLLRAAPVRACVPRARLCTCTDVRAWMHCIVCNARTSALAETRR